MPLPRAAEEGTAEDTPSGQLAADKTKNQAEGAVASSREGDLKSEEAELKRQAKASDLAGVEVNLLPSNDGPSSNS